MGEGNQAKKNTRIFIPPTWPSVLVEEVRSARHPSTPAPFAAGLQGNRLVCLKAGGKGEKSRRHPLRLKMKFWASSRHLQNCFCAARRAPSEAHPRCSWVRRESTCPMPLRPFSSRPATDKQVLRHRHRHRHYAIKLAIRGNKLPPRP